MQIDKDNDSLLTFDSLIVKVYSKDSSFSQEVFHGVLRDPKQVASMPLDPRVGKEYKVSIVGYKGGRVGVNKEVTMFGPNNFQSKDLPIGADTVKVNPSLSEILAPSDTSVAEGDSLRFRVTVRNPLSGPTTFTLKDALPGAALDTVGRDPGDGYFTWRPSFSQGRTEPYAVTFVHASADRKVEKIIRVKVLNINRPPKLLPIADQKAKESELLSFKVEATDPDHDSLTLTAAGLPSGAGFSAGSFTWKPSSSQTGNYALKFKVTDGSASDSLEMTIAVGNITPLPGKPLVQGQTPTSSKTPTWTWKSGGGGAGIFRYRLDDENLSTALSFADMSFLPPTELSEGSHTLFVQEANADGAWSQSGRFAIRVDVTPPGIPKVTVSPTSLTNNPKPGWSWLSGGKGDMGTFRYRLDNGDLNSAPEVKVLDFTPVQNLTEGRHTLYVQERDSAGNWSGSGEMAVTIDLTAPRAPTVTVTPASPTNNPKPTWNWATGGNGGIGTFRFRLDSTNLNDMDEGKAATFTLAQNLSDGTHTLYVQERDSAGNWSPSGQAMVRIDQVPPGSPEFDSLPKSPLNTLQPTWNWKSGGNAGMGIYRCKVDDSSLASGPTLVNGGSYSAPAVLTEGLHTLHVQERDSAGNWSPRSSRSIVLALRGYVGGAGISAGSSTNTSLAITPGGVPYLAYTDLANGWKATVKRLNASGTGWEIVGGAGLSAGKAYFTSLVMSPAGVPYIAFSNEADSGKAIVLRLNTAGTAWDTVGGAGFSAGGANYISLALTSGGMPYIAFVDGAYGAKATVMRLNTAGTFWETVGGAGFSAGTAYYPSLAITRGGTPYLSFRDGANGGKATVMRLNSSGSAWETVGGAGFTAEAVTGTSLTLTLAGVPYLGISDFSSGARAMVMRLNATGSAWETVGGAGISAGFASSPSLVLTPAGVPYVAFSDATNGDRATVMRLNASGSAWDPLGSTGTPGGGGSPFLALSSAGVPYIAFPDGTNGQKAAVMKASFDP
ncbi:MAG TPA: putative Ig domain-containing protein [Fibrobacteria bacterium]|nr:putative Ig domain-containing protein [Fibrobacteria bacterium]